MISVLFGIYRIVMRNCRHLPLPFVEYICFTKGRAEISPIVSTFYATTPCRRLENAFFERSTKDSLPSFLTGVLSSINAYSVSIILKIILLVMLIIVGL